MSKEELGERASNGTFLINLHAKNGSGGVGSKFTRRERRQARIIADLKRSGITQPEEVVQLLYKRKEERNWKWSTLRTAFGEVLGALSRPRKFGHSLQWMVSSDTMKDCGHRLDVVVAQEDVKFPHTLTKKEISRAIIYGLERNWKLAVSVRGASVGISSKDRRCIKITNARHPSNSKDTKNPLPVRRNALQTSKANEMVSNQSNMAIRKWKTAIAELCSRPCASLHLARKVLGF